MSAFRYRQDIIPVTIFVSYFFVDLLVFFKAESLWFVVFWMLLGILPKAMICSWNHHHQHVLTFRQPLLNHLLEIVYGLQTGVTGNAWVLHHNLGHHLNYLDQSADESRWQDAQGNQMAVHKYSLITALTAYPRCFEVGPKFPKQFKPFLAMASITLLLLGFFFYWNPINAFFVFALPMWISLYNTVWHTFYHHSGLQTDDEYQASYNIVEKWYNIFTGNLGYHTAHHVKMGLHWSQLPQYHEKIKEKIPQTLYRLPPAPFKWIADPNLPAYALKQR